MESTNKPAPSQVPQHGPEATPAPTTGSGRPRVLTDAKCREVCTLVAAGCGVDGAARHIGCIPKTIRREANRNPKFGTALRQAIKTAELNPLNAVQAAASRHWRAAAWLLERTNPKQFARQNPEAIPIENFQAFVDELGSEIVGCVQSRHEYLQLLGKLRRLAEKVQHDARIRRELPAFKPRRPPETESRPAASPSPNNSTTR